MDNNKRLSESSSTHNTTCRYPIKDGGIFDTQNQYHAVSLSGGKDSTAMLLLMIERGMPIDVVLTADTGMEFPEMYEHLAKVDDYLFRERDLHITTLRHPKGFEWMMFEEPKQRKSSIENRARYGVPPYGNGWPGIRVRWCTGQLKTHLVKSAMTGALILAAFTKYTTAPPAGAALSNGSVNCGNCAGITRNCGRG